MKETESKGNVDSVIQKEGRKLNKKQEWDRKRKQVLKIY